MLPSRSGRSTIRRLRVMTTREPPEARTRPGDDTQPVAQRAAGGSRSSLVETIGRANAEQRGDLFGRAVDPAAAVLDEVARRLR